MPSNNTISIDFDRVIHKYPIGWVDGTIYGEPVEGAIESIKKLQDDGYKIIVLTAYSSMGKSRNILIEQWLLKHGIKNVEVTNT